MPFTKGSASPHLNIGALRQFSFLLPTMAEQRRIVERLQNVGSTHRTLALVQGESGAKMDAIMPSTLGQEFRGEL